MDQKAQEVTPLRILHLEDSPQDAEIIGELLIDAGMDVTMDRVATEDKFVESLRRRKYDIILADFKLPGFDAFGALRWSTDICPDIPFICVSGTIGEESAVELIRLGADDYVLKDRLKRLPSAIKRARDRAQEKETRKQAEEALRESEAYLKEAMKIAKLGSWKYDVQKDQFTFNDQFYSLFGTTAELEGGYVMSSGHYAQKFLHPDDSVMVGIETRKALETADPDYTAQVDHRIICKNGEIRDITVRIRIKKDEYGQTVMTYGVNQDITHRKRIEEALRENENRLRQIAERSRTFIWEVDAEGLYSYASHESGTVVGYRPEEIVGKKHFYDLHPDAGRKEFKEAAFEFFSRKDSIINLENPIQTKEGQLVWVLTNGIPILDANGRLLGYRGSDIDITNRKLTEEKIRNNLKEKEILLKELYHRTKNNMQVISSMLRLRARSEKEQKLSDAFKDIENKILSMALVHQKLYESKDLSHLDLKDYLSSLISLVTQSYLESSSQITFRTKLKNIHVLIDTAVPLGLIVNELLTNAIVHGFPDDKQGEIRVNLHLTSKNDLVLEISDNGIGLPKNFDFKRDIHLGLQTVFDLVESQLDGKITFTSKNGLHCHLVFGEELYLPRV